MNNENSRLEIVLQHASECLAEKQFEAAGNFFRDALAIAPDHANANYWLGRMALDSGDIDGALGFLRRAMECDAGQPDYVGAYIDALIMGGRIMEARAMLDIAGSRGVSRSAISLFEERLSSGNPAPVQQSEEDQRCLGGYPGSADTTPAAAPLPSRADLDGILAAFQKGRFDHVIGLAREFTRRFPGHDFGWKALGAGPAEPWAFRRGDCPDAKGGRAFPRRSGGTFQSRSGTKGSRQAGRGRDELPAGASA